MSQKRKEKETFYSEERTTVDLEQHEFERCGSTYMWIFFRIHSQPSVSPGFTSTDSTNCRLKTVFLNCGWESTEVEGCLYALFSATLHTGLEHLQILLSADVLEPMPRGYWGTTVLAYRAKESSCVPNPPRTSNSKSSFLETVKGSPTAYMLKSTPCLVIQHLSYPITYFPF